MVLHDYLCEDGHYSERLVDTSLEGWKHQPCTGDCPLIAEQTFLSRQQKALNRLPIVIYRGPNGEAYFPGSANEAMPAAKKAQGYVRQEMTFHEAKRFQKEFNAQERAKSADKLEFMHYLEGEKNRENRSDLLHQMRNMSDKGREYAEYVIEQSNSRDASKYYSQDPGFRIEILED